MTRITNSRLKTPRRWVLLLLSIAPVLCADTYAEPIPATPKKTGTTGDIASAVGLNQIKLEMAESRFKLTKDPKAINDLINALEDNLTTNCMGKLIQTLTYAGNPTDPTCVARMERLLEINPTNPVAICVRDGIAAKSCWEAYLNQKVAPVYSGTNAANIDPALKVGLSAATMERIEKVEETLLEVNNKYQAATDPQEKRNLINDAATLYDQALSMACKVSSVSIVPSDSQDSTKEAAEITQAKERLLQIPAAIRADYQKEMENKAREEMNKSSTSEARKRELNDLIKAIQDPSGKNSAIQLTNVERTRLILEKCATLIDVAGQIVPDLPAVTCYRDGWYTPRCVVALKKWRQLKQQERSLGKGTPAPKAGTPSIISSF